MLYMIWMFETFWLQGLCPHVLIQDQCITTSSMLMIIQLKLSYQNAVSWSCTNRSHISPISAIIPGSISLSHLLFWTLCFIHIQWLRCIRNSSQIELRAVKFVWWSSNSMSAKAGQWTDWLKKLIEANRFLYNCSLTKLIY